MLSVTPRLASRAADLGSILASDVDLFPGQGPYAPQGSRKLRKWSRRSKSVLQPLIRTSEVHYSRSISEVNSNRVTSSLLRKWTRLPTHVCEVRALTFEVTDNFGSNDVLPCGAYGPRSYQWLRNWFSSGYPLPGAGRSKISAGTG